MWAVKVPDGSRPPQADLQIAWTAPVPVAPMVVVVIGAVDVVVGAVVLDVVVLDVVVWAGAVVVVLEVDVVVVDGVVVGGVVSAVATRVEVVDDGGTVVVGPAVVELWRPAVPAPACGSDASAPMAASLPALSCQAQATPEPTPTRPAGRQELPAGEGRGVHRCRSVVMGRRAARVTGGPP